MMRSTLLAVAVTLAAEMMLMPAYVNAMNSDPTPSECSDSGGYCAPPSKPCSVTLPQYTCNPEWKTCCAECDSSSCTGICRAKGACNESEFTVNDCGQHCDCCEPVQADDCKGQCVSHPGLCSNDNYIDGTCTGGNFACCVSCGTPDGYWSKFAGYCVGPQENCPATFYYINGTGLKGCPDPDCNLCVFCEPTFSCAEGPNHGRCVTDQNHCNGDKEYISSNSCWHLSNAACYCCKTCTPDKICSSEGGECRKEMECALGHKESSSGSCNTNECICCVPDS